MLRIFHDICNYLGVSLAKEKIVCASLVVVFLGILLDGQNHLLALPQEKIDKAVNWLQLALNNKKILVKDVERLTGLLNFLNKAIVPGLAFIRQMYPKIAGKTKRASPHIFRPRVLSRLCCVVETTQGKLLRNFVSIISKYPIDCLQTIHGPG